MCVGGKGDRIARNCVLLFFPIGEYFAKFVTGISSLVPSVNKLQISSLPSQLSHQPNTIKPGQVHYLGTHGACDAAQSLIWLMNQLWQGILCSALYPLTQSRQIPSGHSFSLSLLPQPCHVIVYRKMNVHNNPGQRELMYVVLMNEIIRWAIITRTWLGREDLAGH